MKQLLFTITFFSILLLYVITKQLQSPETTTNRFIRKPTRLSCCDKDNERCNWLSTPPFVIPECEKENLVSMLRWLDSILTVEWSITAGTLLGSVREKGHIQHETDIDITVESKNRETLIKQIYNNIRDTHFVLQTGGLTDRLFFSENNKVHVDIWTNEKLGSQTLEITNVEGIGFIRYGMDNNLLYPIKRQCEYEGDIYPCYQNAVAWVRFRYGPFWNVSKKKYGKNSSFKDGDDMEFKIIDKPPKLKKILN